MLSPCQVTGIKLSRNELLSVIGGREFIRAVAFKNRE